MSVEFAFWLKIGVLLFPFVILIILEVLKK